MIEVAHLAASHGDEQCVVGQFVSLARLDGLTRGLNRREGVLSHSASASRACPRADSGESNKADGLANGRGSVDELVVGGDQRDVDQVADETAQAQHALDGSDTPPQITTLKPVMARG